MPTWEHQIIMLEIHQAKKLIWSNPQIKFILHRCIVTRLCSHHLQTLPSSTTMPHSTWHQAQNRALVQPKDIRVMGHRGKHMITPMEVMVDLKCSPLSNAHYMGPHLQVHLECLQHWLETIQLFGRQLPPLLHHHNFLPHLGNPGLTPERNDCSCLRICQGQMLQGWPTCLHYQRFPKKDTMQIMRTTIRQTRAGPKTKLQSAWCKRNSPWSNSPKRWGRPTLMPSTSVTKYASLGFWRRSISPLSGARTIWNCCEKDPCTGKRRLQMLWRHSRPASLWKFLIMQNGFGNSGLKCFWRNVHAKFKRQGRWEDEATSDWWRIW